MKKNTILKVLSFVLLLAVAISAVLLTGCGKQEDVAKQTDLEATNADLKAAKDEIAKLQTAIGKLQEASATSEALSQKVADLETALEAVSGDPEAIRGLVAQIEDARADLQTAQEELGAAVQEATEALDALDEVYATDAQLADEIAALKNGVIKDLQTAVAALQGATGVDEALGELTAIINNRLVKSDWIEATDVLFDDNDPRSIAAFKRGIVRVGDTAAMPYEDADIKAYEAQADLLADKLLRAISLKDIDDTFALRDQLFAALTPIVEKFDAELTRLEPDKDADGNVIPGTGKLYFPAAYIANFYGNNPEGVDQLARLDDLKELIDERGLFPTETEEEVAYKEAQEARYDAIHEAQGRLADAEEDDEEIYEDQEELGLGREDTVYLKDETKANLDTIKGEYDEQVAPQFDDELVDTTYYAVNMNGLPGYVNYLNKLARYEELGKALEAFRAKYPELTHFQDYNTTDPMLDAYTGIELIDGAWLDNWKDDYSLNGDEELENCFIIVDYVDHEQSEGQAVTRLGGYGRVLAIRYFVQTLKALDKTYVQPLVAKDEHEDIITKNLIGQIQTEVKLGANKVRWAHVPTLDDIFAKQDAIYEAIDNLKFELNVDFTAPISYDYNPKANCKKNLLGLDKLTNGEAILAAIRTRVGALKATMQDLIDLGEYLFDTYYVDGEWVVSLHDGNYIKTELPDIVKGFFTQRGIYVDVEDEDTNGENYDVMTHFFRTNIQPYLNAAYDNIAEILKAIWKDVKDVVEKEDTYLPDLNKLITAQATVFKVMADATVDELNIVLDETTGDKFGEFFYKLFGKVVRVVELAQNAEEDAIAINQAIEALDAQFDLNKTAAVDAISEDVKDWSEEYLGVEFPELDEEEDYAEAVKAYFADIVGYFVDTKVEEKTLTYPVYIVSIDEEGNASIIADYDRPYTRTIKTVVNDGILNIYEYNNETISSTDVYDFITGENFTALKAIQAARVATYKSAAEAWAEVNMTPEANRADIDASFEAFTDYVREYYTNIRDEVAEATAIQTYYGLVGVADPVHGKTEQDDLAEKIQAKMVEEATGSQGIKMKADRYASYIVGSGDAQEYVGEFGELVAYESLCDRSEKYDAIMDLVEYLDDQTVPAAFIEDFEGDVCELKSLIDEFREEFEYVGFIGNKAIIGTNGARLDADLVAYVGAAKVYIINAFAKNQAESYLYVKEDPTDINGVHYSLPNDEETVLTSYCVEALQKVCESIGEVDNLIGNFRSLALDPNKEEYRNFDYDSEDHFLEEVEEGGEG